MKIYVFSDIHNNFLALSYFYNFLQENYKKGDKVIFLGDFIGYLKFNVKTISLLIEMGKKYDFQMIAGNHDGAIFNYLGKTKLNIDLSPALLETIVTNINYKDEILKLLRIIKFSQIELNFNNKDYVFTHAGISDKYNHYYYPDLKFIDKYEKFFKDNTTYVFGHTHRAFMFKKYLNEFINVGSLGLPRDNDSRGSFLEIGEKSSEIIRFFYQLDELYNYNISLGNEIKNRIYFGGNSSYINKDLLVLEDYHNIIKSSFINYKLYKRAIYIDFSQKIYQIYKIKVSKNIYYLLRDSKDEIIYSTFSDVIRGIKGEKI